MRVVNMAHGAYYLLGGYIGLSITRYTGSFALGVLGGGLAIIAARLPDRPLPHPPHRRKSSGAGAAHRRHRLRHRRRIASRSGAATISRCRRRSYLRGAIELPGGIIYPTYRFVLILFGDRRRPLALAALSQDPDRRGGARRRRRPRDRQRDRHQHRPAVRAGLRARRRSSPAWRASSAARSSRSIRARNGRSWSTRWWS